MVSHTRTPAYQYPKQTNKPHQQSYISPYPLQTMKLQSYVFTISTDGAPTLQTPLRKHGSRSGPYSAGQEGKWPKTVRKKRPELSTARPGMTIPKGSQMDNNHFSGKIEKIESEI